MKRSDALRPLSDDHHGALVLARRCGRLAEDAPEKERAALRDAVLVAWQHELLPHFRIEEEALLPALEALGERAFARGIAEDHRALAGLRDRIAAAPPAREECGAALRAFGARLARHVRYEEREVFAAVQDRLGPAQEEALRRAEAAWPRHPAGAASPGGAT